MSDLQQIKRITVILSIIALMVIPVYLLLKLFVFEQEQNQEAVYVGGAQCIECHQKEYEDWKGSDHDLAMDIATDSTVVGDFSGVRVERAGQVHECYKKGDQFFVLTDGPKGLMEEFEVKYVFGHYPLQQYLVEFEQGRLQTLALTWNSKDHEWFYMADSVYRNQSVDHKNWLHWTNQSQNWNSMCADCHSTNLQLNFNHQNNSYQTTWTDIDVNCESCHGPGSQHLKWAENKGYFFNSENYGLYVNTSTTNNAEYVDLCARCHSRRTAFNDDLPQSRSIYNHMNPSLPMEPLFFIDGQILEEDYVYASFTQSKMFMHDVKCNDCHNVHSGKLILEGNSLCLQCHQSQVYDSPRHHFHKSKGEEGKSLVSYAGIQMEVGSGTECIHCHMHGRNFMGVDYRKDHSFRIPRPDLSIELGVPNACNQCHTNQTNEWSLKYVNRWYGENKPFHFAEVLNSAQKNEKSADEKLREIITDELYPSNVRSLCIQYLNVSDSSSNQLISESLLHLEPNIRISAIRAFPVQSIEDMAKLAHLLADEVKAVRIEASSKINAIGKQYLDSKYQVVFDSALSEYFQTLLYNADFPSGKANLGNYYFNIKDEKKAEMYFKAALNQDQELHQLRVNLGLIYSRQGRLDEAENSFRQYIKFVPEDYYSYFDFGLLLAENRKYQESLKYLEIASEHLQNNSRVDYNIAMIYEFLGEIEKARSYLEKAISKDPENTQNQQNLIEFDQRNKKG